MALTTDSTTNFPNGGAGYTFVGANIEFVSGAHIKAGVTGSHNILTPSINVGSWNDAIYGVVVTLTEAAGYFHRFLVSFDGGTTLNRYGPGGWEACGIADITTGGNSQQELENVREWPDLADISGLLFAVQCNREASGSGYGNITLIAVSYGTTVEILDDEPDGSDVLQGGVGGLGIMPDFPIERSVELATTDWRTSAGYEASVPTATNQRSSVPVTWGGRTEAERDDIIDWILDHQQVAFVWTLPSETSSRKWVAGDYSQRQQGPESWAVDSTFIEVLPT